MFGRRGGYPSVFWFIGGTDPALWNAAVAADRVAEDIPFNHAPGYAPVQHPTLEAGIEAMITAAGVGSPHPRANPRDRARRATGLRWLAPPERRSSPSLGMVGPVWTTGGGRRRRRLGARPDRAAARFWCVAETVMVDRDARWLRRSIRRQGRGGIPLVSVGGGTCTRSNAVPT